MLTRGQLCHSRECGIQGGRRTKVGFAEDGALSEGDSKEKGGEEHTVSLRSAGRREGLLVLPMISDVGVGRVPTV